MQKIYTGKTKDVYRTSEGNFLLQFKDDVTGTDGVFDPGANTVGLTIEGAGRAGLRLTRFFFEKINAAGIPTHYLSADIDRNTMTVRPAHVFGKGVEVILRYRAVGSFYRRYGEYCEEGAPLDGYVELTLKDDSRDDPLITSDALEMLGIMGARDYARLVAMTRQIGQIVRDELAKKELDLYDIKFEFGKLDPDGQVALIDEISGGNMRVYHLGRYVEPLALAEWVLENR